jgi:hypothetical protein
MPLMHGLPPRLPGSWVIIFWYSFLTLKAFAQKYMKRKRRSSMEMICLNKKSPKLLVQGSFYNYSLLTK